MKILKRILSSGWLVVLLTWPVFAHAGKEALVIIDMQPYFICRARNHATEEFYNKVPNLIKNVIAHIEKAKSKNKTILIVEYRRKGMTSDLSQLETHPEIMDAISDYPKLIKISKTRDSGAKEIRNKLRKKKLNIESLEVCGVNTSACVTKTVEDLVALLEPINRISVLTDACQDAQGNSFHWHGLSYLSDLPKVKLECSPDLSTENSSLLNKLNAVKAYLQPTRHLTFLREKRAYRRLFRLIHKRNHLDHEGEQSKFSVEDQILKILHSEHVPSILALTELLSQLKPQNAALKNELVHLLNHPDLQVQRNAEKALLWSSPEKLDTANLVRAIKNINYSRAQEILEQGLDPNLPHYDQSVRATALPLNYAIISKNEALVRLILQKGAKPYLKDDEMSPLGLAAEVGDPKILEILIAAGFNAKDEGGNEPGYQALNIAAAHCNGDAVQLLVKHGADPSPIFRWRKHLELSTLQIASSKKCTEVVEFLITRAQLNLREELRLAKQARNDDLIWRIRHERKMREIPN